MRYILINETKDGLQNQLGFNTLVEVAEALSYVPQELFKDSMSVILEAVEGDHITKAGSSHDQSDWKSDDKEFKEAYLEAKKSLQ